LINVLNKDKRMIKTLKFITEVTVVL